MNPQLEKYKEILKLIQNDTLTPKVVEEFLLFVLQFISKSKASFDELSVKNIEEVHKVMTSINQERTKFVEDMESKEGSVSTVFTNKLLEAEKLLQKIRLIKVTPGRDGHDGKDADEAKIIAEVLSKIKIPPPEKFIPETGESIVTKINELPTGEDDSEEKIDWRHIKNVPDFRIGSQPNGGGWRNLFQLHDVSITDPQDDDVLTYDAATKTWQNKPGGGGGASGVNFETPVGAIDGSNLIFTVSNTPKAIVLNGATYFEGVSEGYTLAALTITLNATLVPATGSTLRSMY